MKRIGIIGAGRFGATLAENLVERGVEVVLLDRDRDVIQRMSTMSPLKAIQGDATNERALIEAGFKDCDAIVVAIGANIEVSILATVMLKEMNVPFVVAKATSDIHGKALERIGADMVVYPEKDRARRLARSLLTNSALDIFEIADGISVVEMKVPDDLAGKTLGEAQIRKVHGITVLMIRRAPGPGGKQKNVLGPTAEDRIEKGDTLIIFGPDKKVDTISQ